MVCKMNRLILFVISLCLSSGIGAYSPLWAADGAASTPAIQSHRTVTQEQESIQKIPAAPPSRMPTTASTLIEESPQKVAPATTQPSLIVTAPATPETEELNLEINSTAKPTLKLLPDRISLLERGIWGEKGLLRSIHLASPLTAEARARELEIRRAMLTAHQIGGFVTFGLLLATVFYGQKYLDQGGQSTLRTHETLVDLSLISYFTTASLSLFSPPPLVRKTGVNTTSIHKALALVHFTGMILTPVIAGLVKKNSADWPIHQASAYITTTVFGASLFVIMF